MLSGDELVAAGAEAAADRAPRKKSL